MCECQYKKLRTLQAFSSHNHTPLSKQILFSNSTNVPLKSSSLYHHPHLFTCASQNTPLIILAPPLTPRPHLLAGKIPRPLKHTALPELAANSVVDAVLEPVDVLVTRDLRFREVVCD
jgi:hypothetical protein